LDLVDICAVRLNVSTIIDIVVLVHQTNARNPIPDDLCMLSICIVGGISSKTGTKVEEAAVRDGVLVVVSGKIWVHLPSESARYQYWSQSLRKPTHPPPQYESGLVAWVLKTACARESQEG
jgi:hypothetical protein